MSKIKRGKLDNGEHVLYDNEDGHVICYCENKTTAKLIKLGLQLVMQCNCVEHAKEIIRALETEEGTILAAVKYEEMT